MSAFDPRARTFVEGRGTMLRDAAGHTVFDAISSVWTTIHGHGHPAIVEAIARQARTLDHATALGATNPRAEELAARLANASGLDYAFFSGDGASAVEAALKMALKYWRNVGRPERRTFVHLTSSYHGDTTGAMSVSDIARFRADFGAICFETVAADDLGTVLERDDLAAVIVEPLVQAAAGLRTVEPSAYAPLAARDETLLVVDEIATGFGRTGTLFACEQLDLQPDLMCLGKGLTGGTLALSATLATERIYDAFLGAPEDERHFYHGHSFAANPIACAAALASLDLFATESTLAHARTLRASLEPKLERLRAHPAVADVRGAGLMIGVELAPNLSPIGHGATTPAWRIANELYARGHFTRPIGNTLQLVPPLCSTHAELAGFIDALLETLDA